MGMKLALALLIVIAVMTGGFYLYYKDSQQKIAILTENAAKAELAVETQKETMRHRAPQKRKPIQPLRSVREARRCRETSRWKSCQVEARQRKLVRHPESGPILPD